MSTPPPLTSFRALSFDIYGTLIDWPTGLLSHFRPLLARAPTHPLSTPTALLAAFARHEQALQASSPKTPYSDILAQAYTRVAEELGVQASPNSAETFATSIGAWPAFPDTVSAMQSLSNHYELIALSNITNASISCTLSGPLAGVPFAAVYTAEDIGSYKPSHANFTYLLRGVEREFGVQREGLLHVAHGVGSDMVPAGEMGIARAWI
ncbi:hypothetical protein MMC30_009365, partial [Trapelia coarctata]|nr:hypothetical protein [Trapelia coarctata]